MTEKISKIKNYVVIIQRISNEVFSIFLIGYLFFFLLDEVFNNFISNFINLNYILIIVITTGFLTVFLDRNSESKIENSKTKNKQWLNYIITIGLGIIAVIVVFFKLQDINLILNIIISILSGLLISLVSYLFLNNNRE